METCHSVGISFQLIDDLTELIDEKPGHHEMTVNPWLSCPETCQVHLINHLERIKNTLAERQLKNTEIVLNSYFKKMKNLILTNNEMIQNHIVKKVSEFNLSPLMTVL